MFAAHCIPEATEDFNVHFFYYSTPSWNKSIVYGILKLKENIQPVTRIVIDIRTAITKAFIPLVNLPFLHCRLMPISIHHNISEGELYNKTQNFMFAPYSIAHIFKWSNQQFVGTNKQLTLNDNNA
jgi:hypothetical protein